MSTEKNTKTVELTLDQRVEALFAKLQEKKAEVANAERPQWITNGQFRYSESTGSNVDIVSERSELKLISILGFVRERAASFEIGANEVGSELKFSWLGFSADEWANDIKTRLSILQITKKRTELAELEKRVNAVMTPELRREMEMKALEAAL